MISVLIRFLSVSAPIITTRSWSEGERERERQNEKKTATAINSGEEEKKNVKEKHDEEARMLTGQ